MRSLLLVLLSVPLAAFAQLKVESDTMFTGVTHAESIGCDPKGKAFYASEFGSKLAPLEKDGAGYISKWSLDGKLIEKNFLPGEGGEKLNKPKGIWVQGNRLWTTDIDSVWVFDLTTKKGRKLALPGAQFANDPAVQGKALFVTDNRTGKSGLTVVGFVAPDQPRAIYRIGKGGKPAAISDPIGRLDGVYELKDGSLLVTDWNTGSLFQWSKKLGVHKLADGFMGPADFCAIERKAGVTVYVPDLVQSQVRIIKLK